ncbi:MAG: hypothetical protein AAF682_32455 [Planctomycetota bacterium]
MKAGIRVLLASLCILPLTACGEGGVEASELMEKGQEALGELDLSALSPEAMTEKAGELLGGVTSKFDEIKDVASAENVKSELEPMLGQIAKLKDVLGDKMPNLDSLKTAADDLMSKFGGDTEIMKVLQPVIDKIKTMLG